MPRQIKPEIDYVLAGLGRLTLKGSAALSKSAQILLYKAVCTVNIPASWVWVVLTPFKVKNGTRNPL